MPDQNCKSSFVEKNEDGPRTSRAHKDCRTSNGIENDVVRIRGDLAGRTETSTCPLSVEFLKTGRQVAGDCCSEVTVPPAWFDRRKFDRARLIFKENFFSVFFAHLAGLTMIVTIRTILEPLVYTGKSSNLPALYRRYLDTLRSVRTWYEGDIWQPDDRAHRSIMHVRRMHKNVASQLNTAQHACPASQPTYMSQYDMVVTQFAFIGFIVLYPRRLGFFCSRDDLECLVHFWRSVGYLLGIADEYNLCGRSLSDTELSCKEILDRIIKPGLVAAPKEGVVMSKDIIRAVRVLVVFLSYEGMMRFWAGLIGMKFLAVMSLYDWWCYGLIWFTFKVLLRYAVFRNFFNWLLKLAIRRGVVAGDYLQRQLVLHGERKTSIRLKYAYKSG